jgi:hypothetical protein
MSRDAGAPEHIRVGPAGWPSPDGEGRVSPTPKRRGSDPLAYPAQSVATIGIKSTCSRIPSITLTTSWTWRVSDHPDVRWPVTRWQGCTHEEQTGAEEGGAAHGCRFRAGVCPHPC